MATECRDELIATRTSEKISLADKEISAGPAAPFFNSAVAACVAAASNSACVIVRVIGMF